VFEADDRIDPNLFALAFEATGFLDETLAGLALNENDVAFASRFLLIYYGARIYGATTAGVMLLAQRQGREATIMARCQYDYFIQMLYYDTYRDEANNVLSLLSQNAYHFRFSKRAGLDITDTWNEEEAARLEVLARRAKEPDFTVQVKERLLKDPEFAKAAEDGNPFAAWFFKNVEASFRTHWTYGGSIVHAAPVDIPNVIIRHENGYTVTVDSRMKAPNKTIADLTQRCFSAMGLIRWRCSVEMEEKHIAWAARFQEVADRHVDEPTDTRSMHD
jgi:hypothetical protein